MVWIINECDIEQDEAGLLELSDIESLNNQTTLPNCGRLLTIRAQGHDGSGRDKDEEVLPAWQSQKWGVEAEVANQTDVGDDDRLGGKRTSKRQKVSNVSDIHCLTS